MFTVSRWPYNFVLTETAPRVKLLIELPYMRVSKVRTCAVTPLSAASVARRKLSSAASSCASLLKPCASAHLSAHSPCDHATTCQE